jgi:hypothetical protein
VRSTKSPSWISRLAGLGPLPAPPQAFALDGGRLAYGGFDRVDGGFRFREYHREELTAETFQHGPLGGPLKDAAGFEAALGRLVERLAAPVKEASLLVPDAWLRVVFAESGELPAAARERDEVVRWKLKRLVPFRVEELRVDQVEVASLPGQQEPRRLLVGFAAEALLASLEAAFARLGVRLGRITNSSLALLAAMTEPAAGDGLTALVVAEGGAASAAGDGGGYTLVVARDGEPLLHRYKGLAAGLPESARGEFVRRDLALTRNFLAENVAGAAVTAAVVASPPASEAAWLSWLEDGLGVRAEAFGAAHLPPLEGVGPAVDWREVAPLLGAVHQEVA